MNEHRHSNHTVYAVIKPAPGVIRSHLEAALNAKGWSFEEAGDRYTLAIPVYGYWRWVTDRVTRELRVFSRQEVPIYVEEVRRLKAPEDTRHLVRVSSSKISWLPERLRKSSELPFGALHWFIAVPRSQQDNPPGEDSNLNNRAGLLLRKSSLPGEVFDAARMKLTTRAEPIRSHDLPDAWLVIITVLVILVSSVVWGSPPPVVGVASLYFLVGVSIFFGLWMTGDRKTLLPRLGWIVGSLGLLTLLSFIAHHMMSIGIAVLLLLAAAATFLIVWFGCGHLRIIYPNARVLVSMPAVTVMVAFVSYMSQLIIDSFVQVLGIPASGISVPGAFRLLVSGWIALCLISVIAVIAAWFGWGAYFNGPDKLNSLKAIVGFFLAAAIAVTGWVAIVQTARNQVENSWDALRNKETPVLTSDILFRACITGLSEKIDAPSVPVIAAHGTGGVTWWWPEDAKLGDAPSPLETASIKVARLPDGESVCQ